MGRVGSATGESGGPWRPGKPPGLWQGRGPNSPASPKMPLPKVVAAIGNGVSVGGTAVGGAWTGGGAVLVGAPPCARGGVPFFCRGLTGGPRSMSYRGLQTQLGSHKD